MQHVMTNDAIEYFLIDIYLAALFENLRMPSNQNSDDEVHFQCRQL